jgi:murein DD-endopeptidase MepM/ murein hydrolase activator NlpD
VRHLGALLIAALTLALAGTAAADTFVVARPAGGGGAAGTPAAVPFSSTAAASAPTSLSQLRSLWSGAGSTYGIPWQVLAAINKVESNFGRNLGPSSAGAVGWMQFLPSTWLRWGVDANGDGVADPSNPADAIYSAARYLAAAGGQSDLRRAIFAYNHADWYVNEVLGLASMYGDDGAEAVFSLDRLQADVEAARAQVAALNSQLITALARARALARAERRLQRRAERAALLSDRLYLRKRAVLVGVRRHAADRRADVLRSRLGLAQGRLTSTRNQARAASFANAAGQLLSAPVYSGSYVFPVGGGPGEVSVSTGHHDYPAADIAAPEGAPVYALADALVDRAWSVPDGACGIGATITTSDGQTWTYCHLSYLDPAVQPGAHLAAGTSMGLVGHTGHATGPHLHLQLDPTDSYPQDEPWFRAFAGTAFRWQGGGASPTRTLAAVQSWRPLFVVLEQPVVQFTTGSGDDAIPFSQDVVYFTR